MKTVLVTGANGNLGQYVCQSFAKAQWNIIAAVFHDIDDAALSILGASSKLVGDFSNPTQSNSMLAQLDSLDAVVHLVGGIKAGERLEDTSYDDFESMLHINLYSAFNLLHDALPLLKKRGGSIVTVGAKSALHPEANRVSYSVAKAGLISLTQAIAEEGRLYNVRANVIVPSIVKTAANLAWATNGEESSWVEPSDVAQAIVSLCSDAQSVINGAILPMYGGVRTQIHGSTAVLNDLFGICTYWSGAPWPPIFQESENMQTTRAYTFTTVVYGQVSDYSTVQSLLETIVKLQEYNSNDIITQHHQKFSQIIDGNQ